MNFNVDLVNVSVCQVVAIDASNVAMAVMNTTAVSIV